MRWASKLLVSLLLLGVALPVQAEEFEVYPPSGSQVFLGLDDDSAPTQVKDGRAQDLQNVVFDGSGGIRSRYGISLVGSTLDIIEEANCTVTGLYYTKFSSGTERIIATCGNRWTYLNGSSWTTVSGVTVQQTAGQNNQFVFTTALDAVIGTNDVDPPIQHATGDVLTQVDFTSLTSTSRPTKAKTVAFFKNFLVFCNTTEGGVDYATRCRWSNVGTINTWSDEDYVDIGALGGQEITALAELYDNLYVFLTNSIYRVSYVAGADTFQISKVTDDIGAIAKNSVQSVTLSNSQNGLMFLDKDKTVYFFNGIAPQDVSSLIDTTMGTLSASRLQYAVSADTNTDYWLCATTGSGGTNDVCLDFQYFLGEWTRHTGIPANAMAHVVDSNSRDQVYFGTSESFVYELEDDDLNEDVFSTFGTVGVVSLYQTSTASSQQVIYVTGANYTTGTMVGAPIAITAGTGSGQTSTVSYNTATGIVVTDNFTVAPVAGSSFEVGAIDSYYTTKWYDLGQAARLKHFGEVYFWAEAEVTGPMVVSSATDFDTDITSADVSLTADTSDAIWGEAIWGVSLWGGTSDVFRIVKLDGQGRYVRVRWDEDDPGHSFHLYGWSLLARPGDN